LYGVLSDLIRTSAAGLAIGSHFGWIWKQGSVLIYPKIWNKLCRRSTNER
jgi:hypothetical protein